MSIYLYARIYGGGCGARTADQAVQIGKLGRGSFFGGVPRTRGHFGGGARGGGCWIVECKPESKFVDRTGIAGSMAGLHPLTPEEREFGERELDWDLKHVGGR